MNSHELFVKRKFQIVSKLIPPSSKVLDIGCGDGDLFNFLITPNYYAIDGNEGNIKDLLKKGIKAKKIDLNKEELPFKDEKFDFIFLLDVLEHVANSTKLLQESRNRLKNNGNLIITLPNDYHLLNKIRFFFNKPLTEDPFASYGHLHYFPIKIGEDFLRSNKLTIKKKIILSPIKPKIIPSFIKNLLSSLFPQAFSRDILYVLS